MPEIIISDTSCLLVFTNAGQLSLLQDLYGEVLITTSIAVEYKLPLPAWIRVVDPLNAARFHRFLELVDVGEASGIALAMKVEGAKLLMDDLKGRRLAMEMGIGITGSLGVLKAAKDRGLITANNIEGDLSTFSYLGKHRSHQLFASRITTLPWNAKHTNSTTAS